MRPNIFMELYDKVDADVEFTPVDDTPKPDIIRSKL